MKLPFIHLKDFFSGYFKVYVVATAWKNICFIYKDFYDVLHNVTADPARDLTRLYRHSLEDSIKGTQHICIITNGSSSLHEPVVISHQEWLYLSGAKDNNARETLDGDPRGDGGRADEGKDTNKMKKKRDRVGEQEGEKEKRREWQSDGGNTIKGNECHSVIPTVWSRCLCQLSWQPEVRSLSPSHWGKSRLQVPSAGLVMRSARHDGCSQRSSLFR